MSYTKRGARAGVSLIEILMVIAIFLVLFVLTTRSFSTTNASKALDTEAQHIVAELNRARSLTLSSKNSQQYGIHFATTSITLFQSATYEVGSSTNDTVFLRTLIQVASTSFAGGGSNVVFERLTGKTTQNGTVTLSLRSDASRTKTVTIYATGLVETQ